MRLTDFLRHTEHGLYCPPGGFYVDPRHAVPMAVITHAHGDHARAGHGAVLSHSVTLALLQNRFRGNVRGQALRYAEPLLHNGVSISLHPAGHVPGSAQVRIEHQGVVAVVSGDYKLEADGLSTPYEQLRSHLFVTESTFGLPLFHWMPQWAVVADIAAWHRKNRESDRISVVVAYAVGKAQRLLALLAAEGMRVIVHRTIAAVNASLRSQGIPLPEAESLKDEMVSPRARDALIIAPASALREGWLARLAPVSVAHVSGWMALRKFRKTRGGGMGFVMSDHADWNGLNLAVQQSGAERILVTHGYDLPFSRWLRERGFDAECLEQKNGEPVR